MKKISIIVPTYNSSRTIKKTLKSIFTQSYKNYEVIIVDAFSIDNTRRILSSLNNKKIKVYNISKKKGLSYARYYGIKKSTGSLIAFLDSDDVWHRNKLLTQIKLIQNHKFCSTGYSLVKGEKKLVFCNYPKFLNLNSIIYERPIANSTVLVDKKLIYAISKKYQNVKFAEDYLWWVIVMKKIKRTLFIKKNLTNINVSAGGRTLNNFFGNLNSLYFIYRKILKFSYLKIIIIFIFLIKNNLKKKYFYYS